MLLQLGRRRGRRRQAQQLSTQYPPIRRLGPPIPPPLHHFCLCSGGGPNMEGQVSAHSHTRWQKKEGYFLEKKVETDYSTLPLKTATFIQYFFTGDGCTALLNLPHRFLFPKTEKSPPRDHEKTHLCQFFLLPLPEADIRS